MKVEIWSDVVCPWCYIGKRRFETALERFPADEVLGFLASDGGRAEVAGDLARAVELGITAVPTYVFDGRWSVPGAQEPGMFLRVLERVGQLEAGAAESA